MKFVSVLFFTQAVVACALACGGKIEKLASKTYDLCCNPSRTEYIVDAAPYVPRGGCDYPGYGCRSGCTSHYRYGYPYGYDYGCDCSYGYPYGYDYPYGYYPYGYDYPYGYYPYGYDYGCDSCYPGVPAQPAPAVEKVIVEKDIVVAPPCYPKCPNPKACPKPICAC